MNIDRAVMAFAGLVILVSMALGYTVSQYSYGLAVFAGLNLIQASFTGFCPVAMFFRRLGLKPGRAFG
ncbi:YgaP family membrane protein [Bauldia sp.]|uniref:YgaP family membrane protein n=1 Tax=Bauldia sp. TaxID=2575872 RepID=UPI003BA84BBE